MSIETRDTPNEAERISHSSSLIPHSSPTRRELGWALLLIAASVTLFLAPALFTGRYLSPADLLFDYFPWRAQPPPGWTGPANNILSDSVFLYEPYLGYSAALLHRGALPLWNADNYLGAPLLANLQGGLLFPVNWPYLLWPDPALLVVRAWLVLVIAALGTYGLVRDVAGVRPVAAAIATLTFTFGSFLTLWLLYAQGHAIIWLPWLWWATARLVARPGPGPLAALAALVALQMVAGHPETAFHTALATGLFLLFQLAQQRPWSLPRAGQAFALWVLAYMLGAAVSGAQLLPFLEYMAQSHALQLRNERQGGGVWLPSPYFWTLISPDWYGNPARHTVWPPQAGFIPAAYVEGNSYSGVLPLLLAPLALLARPGPPRRLALFLGGTMLLAMGVVYNWPIIYPLAMSLPLMQQSFNTRLIAPIELALGLLAALGLEALLAARAGGGRRVAAALGLTIGAWLTLGVGVPWLLAGSYFGVPAGDGLPAQVWQANLSRAGLLVGLAGGALLALWAATTARPRLAHGLLLLLPAFLLADLWEARADYNPTIASAAYYPPTEATRSLQQQIGRFRVVAPPGVFMPETNLPYGLADLRGYDAIMPQAYYELVIRGDPARRQYTASGLAPSRLWHLLGVRYILVPPGEDPNYVVDVRQDVNSGGGTVGEIAGAHEYGQTFVAGHDTLAGVQVLGATYGGRARGRLLFHLKTAPDAPTDLVTRQLDAEYLPDNSYWSITFPPIRQARGQTFYFSFTSPDAPPGQAATLWYNAADAYPVGARLANGQPVEGDLLFRTLSPVDPEGPWFRPVLSGGNVAASVFENWQALLPARLVHRAAVEPDSAARIRRLYDPAWDLANTALLAAPLPPDAVLPAAPPPPGADSVTLTRYQAETVEIATSSPAAGLLVLSDQVFPGWQAQVDDRSTPIFTADHALRAVYVPAGRHTVRFTYQPLSFTVGAILSIMALLVTACLAAWALRRSLR